MSKLSGVLVVLLWAAPVFAQEAVTFREDLRQFVMKGDDTEKVDVSFTMSAEALTMTPKKGAGAVTIPYGSITGMTVPHVVEPNPRDLRFASGIGFLSGSASHRKFWNSR